MLKGNSEESCSLKVSRVERGKGQLKVERLVVGTGKLNTLPLISLHIRSLNLVMIGTVHLCFVLTCH